MSQPTEKQNKTSLSAAQADFLGYLHAKDTVSQLTRITRSAALIYMRSQCGLSTNGFNQLWAESVKRKWLAQHQDADGGDWYTSTAAASNAFADFVAATEGAHNALDAFYALDAELQTTDAAESVSQLLDDLEEKLLAVMEGHVTPAEPETVIPGGLDAALEMGMDAQMCAGYLQRLADVLDVEDGNAFTVAALRESAVHLMGGV